MSLLLTPYTLRVLCLIPQFSDLYIVTKRLGLDAVGKTIFWDFLQKNVILEGCEFNLESPAELSVEYLIIQKPFPLFLRPENREGTCMSLLKLLL